jgi:Flp pilus assembly protein TadD
MRALGRLLGRSLALSLALAAACTPLAEKPVPAMAVPPLRGALPPVLPADPAELLALDDEMRRFVAVELAPVESANQRLRKLSGLLLQAPEHRLEYQGDVTLNARELYHQRTGNCLSFTALVVALAREAGLDAVFQDVPVVPSWHRAGTAFVVERHVNALVRFEGRHFVFDFRPPETALYSGARVIPDANATAQYYGNLGVEQFSAGDYAGAYRQFERGLAIDPSASMLWVNLGVVFVRNEQTDDAERAYRQALALEPGNLSALNNLALLEQQLGHAFTARRLMQRVERYRRANPYFVYWQGEQSLAAGDAAAARDRFSEALRKVPSEADFHFALARAWLALGDRGAAQASLDAALSLASADSVRQHYEQTFRELSASATASTDPAR